MIENFQEKELQHVKNLNSYDNSICPDWVVEITKISIEYEEPVGIIKGKIQFLIYENNTDKKITEIYESVVIK